MGGLLAARFAQRWPEEVAGAVFCRAVIGDWRWARDVLAAPELPQPSIRRRLAMPVLFLHRTDDPFVPYERALRAVREMPTEDVTVHVDRGARHEVLTETNHDEVIGHLANWIDRVG